MDSRRLSRYVWIPACHSLLFLDGTQGFEALQFCNRGNTDGRGRTGRCAKPLIRAQRRGTHGREFREKRLWDSLQVQQEARLRIIDLLNFAGHLYGMLPEIPGKVQERRKQEREQE